MIENSYQFYHYTLQFQLNLNTEAITSYHSQSRPLNIESIRGNKSLWFVSINTLNRLDQI